MSEQRYRRAGDTVHRVASDCVLVQRIVPLGTPDVRCASFDITGVAALVFVVLDEERTLDELTATITADVEVDAADVAEALEQLTDVGLVTAAPS